ncbi:MAG TPA: RNA polymerase sigma factor [Candidatus Angelobacter sp.]|nr:RNA polymerase sigma factor [Candidatus Angelobacter sp.]
MSEKRELWELIHRGNADAFDAFYAESVHRLQRFLRQLVGNPQVAEDISHETFLQLWRRPNEYRPDRGSPHAYLFGIARKLAAEWWRHGKPEDQSTVLRRVLDGTDGPSNATFNVALSSPPVEERSLVGDAFARLEPDQRALLWLREVEGQSYLDLANILDVPIGTVRSRLHAAREELRRIWHSAPPENGGCEGKNEMDKMQAKGSFTR